MIWGSPVDRKQESEGHSLKGSLWVESGRPKVSSVA